ncbi:hypothetical protein RBE51_21080 [Pseudomonas taiwanensis]|uniref:hypothetical protein n=1 Tax=Pseudomonas taiwanensis TaxID=470150 RepID=UPI0028DD6C77|nr:hypothetical protein [Pseudomonas taiwanensis]MDT8925291.1 hypothetical protein [Pseudomonas taiwanensis]
MKLKGLFQAIPFGHFSSPLKAKLRQLLDAINGELNDIGSDEDLLLPSLFAAHAYKPDLVVQALNTVVSARQGRAELLSSPMVQAAWAADGGHPDVLQGYRVSSDALHAVAGGAHYALLALDGSHHGLKDGARAFALKHFLRSLELDRQHDPALLSVLSLRGFHGEFVSPQNVTTHAARIYLEAYFPGFQTPNTLRPLSPTLVNDLLKATGRLPSNDVQRWLFKVLVYNPGLRLRMAGFDCDRVVEHLLPVSMQVVDAWQQCGEHPLSSTEVRLIERQSMINLAYPSPEHLAALHVTPEEILGHPNQDKDHLPVWAKETLQGPCRVFNFLQGTEVEPGFDQGQLRERPKSILRQQVAQLQLATSLVKEHHRSDMTDRMLVRALEQGGLHYPHADELICLVPHLQPELHEAPAVTGLVAMMIEAQLSQSMLKGRKRITVRSGSLEKRDFRAIRQLIATRPEVLEGLVGYLERNELLSYPLLKACGLDSKVLQSMTVKCPGAVAEEFLMDDLGI